MEFHRRHGVEVTILRPGLIYGVGEKNIPRLLDAIRRGKFRYLGSRDNIVPMVHIDDVVQALLLAAEKPEANGRVYHITDGSRTTIGELVDYLSELSGSPPPQKVLPLIVPKAACVVFETLQRLKLRSKPGPINRVGLRFLGTSRSIDISRARRELGYEPRVSFREGMAATVRAILETEHDTADVVSTAATLTSCGSRWSQRSASGGFSRSRRRRGSGLRGQEANTLAKSVLDAMLTRPFRISKLPPDEEYAQLLAKVRHWVAKGKPVRITLGYAPMKNLNAVRVSRADWSEFFALTHLCTWHNKVCSVYPPGLRIKIIFDDSTVSMANRPDRRHMDNYIGSIGRLIKVLGYQPFIVGTMRQSSFAWLFNFGFYQVAEWRVRRFERDPANQAVVEQMTTFARRNLLLPPGLDEEARERAYQRSQPSLPGLLGGPCSSAAFRSTATA